ncbi:hypothetical protein ACJIZ3_002676 [Penstemon smallii]|uniref:Uncharacterized protein n=1 Tax=Penstemon smallii TaxID=265156 RepID=A0ABD3U9P1_9LAMI
MSSEEGVVIGCHSVDEWKEQFHKATLRNCFENQNLLIDQVTPQFTFRKVYVDELKAIAQEFKVAAMPSFKGRFASKNFSSPYMNLGLAKHFWFTSTAFGLVI